MEKIHKIRDILSADNTLFNSKVEKIIISKSNSVTIRIEFGDFKKNSTFKKIAFSFSDVQECSFHFIQTYNFFIVENYKLLKLENDLIFFSLDPDETTFDYSENDGDFIISQNFDFEYYLK